MTTSAATVSGDLLYAIVHEFDAMRVDEVPPEGETVDQRFNRAIAAARRWLISNGV